jgi:trk system potassium uptake protein TrkH
MRIVIHHLGLLLHVPVVMALATVPVCLLVGEARAVLAFLLTALVSLLVGQVLLRVAGPSPGEPDLTRAMAIAALGWLVLPLLGALPFVLIAHSGDGGVASSRTLLDFREPGNALFESFSGFTGTGLTVASNPAELPRSLQWWRSAMQWVGGVGVIVLMLSMLRPGRAALLLYRAEAREERLLPTVSSTARAIWWIFLTLTVATVLGLRVSGLPWWEALNHGMTGIATGGFTVNAGGFAAYGARPQVAVLAVMVVGATSFGLYRSLFSRRGSRRPGGDGQVTAMVSLLVLGAGLVLLETGRFPFESTALDPVFQWVSALTTTGFQTVNLQSWPDRAKVLLAMGMIVGGAAGSTAGGIKLARLILLSRAPTWLVRRLRRRPHEMLVLSVGGETLAEDEANRRVGSAALFTLLWLLVLSVNVFGLAHVTPTGLGLSDVVLEVCSAQSNVGLTTGLTGPELHPVGKFILVLSMWLGRLEILPALVLIDFLFGGPRRWRPASAGPGVREP